MRHYFLDASALVKAYSVEPGSERVKKMIRGAGFDPPDNRVLASALIRPEAASALAKILDGPHAARRGFGRLHRRSLPGALARDLATPGLVLAPADQHIESAVELVWKHRVRGADAVHLATALAARRDLPAHEEFYFVSSDVSLNSAAAAEGLEVIDPAA